MADKTHKPGPMKTLFSFPHPVNEVSARLIATGVVILAVITLIFDQPWITAVLAYVLVALVLIPASLEAFAGYCIGCKIFGILARVGIIPASLCAECADIWGSRADQQSPRQDSNLRHPA